MSTHEQTLLFALAEPRLRTAASRGSERGRRVRRLALPPFPQPGVVPTFLRQP